MGRSRGMVGRAPVTAGLSEASRRTRVAYSVVFLFVLTLGLGVGNLFWTSHEVNVNNSARASQGVVIERKLCSTLHALVALQPPAGAAATNPSRAYDQQLHRALSQLYPDLGCGTAPYLRGKGPHVSAPVHVTVTSAPPGGSAPAASRPAAVPSSALASRPAASPSPASSVPAEAPVLLLTLPCSSLLLLRVCIGGSQ